MQPQASTGLMYSEGYAIAGTMPSVSGKVGVGGVPAPSPVAGYNGEYHPSGRMSGRGVYETRGDAAANEYFAQRSNRMPMPIPTHGESSASSAPVPAQYADANGLREPDIGGSTSSSPNPQRWQEAYLDLEQKKRRLQSELRGKSEEHDGLTAEVQHLREQIMREQEKRKERVSELARQLEALERDNKQLNMKLMKVQMQDSAKLSDVTTVKKEVVTKTMELEKMMRDFQQTHQQALFAKVKTITGAMLTACQKPDLSSQIRTPVPTDDMLMPSEVQGLVTGGAAADGTADAQGGSFMDPETQQALKRRLQSLGDVVVFTSDNFEACCASGRAIPPGALRIRPRRCDHVFLVECLLPYWAEGLCPVCRTSFAYDPPRDNWNDELDKYSSVSTSVSQRQNPIMARPPIPSSAASDASSALARGVPRSMRAANNGAVHSDSKRRSSSASRAHRRRRSADGADTRSDRSGDRSRVGSSIGHRGDRGLSVSPPRSVVSVQSRASSVPRERYASPSAQSPMSPSPVRGSGLNGALTWGGSESGGRRGPL